MIGTSMLRIRAFRAGDQVAARNLINAGLGEHFGCIDGDANPDLIDIEASYISRGHPFFVAELSGLLVGTTGMLILPPRAQLVRVSVAKAQRRCGVATALLRHCVEHARTQGLSILEARTQPEWIDASRFYLRHGFRVFGKDSIDVHLRRDVTL